MNIKKARQLLGSESEKYSDEELENILGELGMLADIVIDQFMEKNSLEGKIKLGCTKLYEKDKLLIDNRAHERTIASRLAIYLQPLFEKDDLVVDTDYNREGIRIKSKRRSDGSLINPDIIIHKRGVNEFNLVAIQIKGFWNSEDRSKDENDLIDLREKLRYRFLYRLELGYDTFELIPI